MSLLDQLAEQYPEVYRRLVVEYRVEQDGNTYTFYWRAGRPVELAHFADQAPADQVRELAIEVELLAYEMGRK